MPLAYSHIILGMQLQHYNKKRNMDGEMDEKINAPVAVRGEMFGGNKLRTYRTFKNEFITEPYLSIIVHKKYINICQV